jgi:tRNA nucleotidyltransferase (CCA-adding enzyme)
MPKPGVGYPQVEARVTGLMDTRVMAFAPDGPVAGALAAARRTGAEVIVLGGRGAARRRDLERAAHWGLGGFPARALGWEGLPSVPARAPETVARRLVIGGAPLILVRSAGRVTGAIDSERVEIARPAVSLLPQLDHLDSREGEARLWLLRVVGKVAEGLGVPVFAVGGFVRDLLLGTAAPDVDLCVEGDGVAFAKALCEEIGGHATTHEAFGTASIEGTSRPSGVALGRIDVASARRERYDAPGALPVVSPATVQEDLRRRDFSANALALSLHPPAFGRLLDPAGGRADLARRRLRPLHPLSFVEDPTRIFRAARYAARLGLRLDAMGLRAVKLALAVGRYPALSGQRLRAELDLLAAEPRRGRGVALLLRWRALRLWDRAYAESPAGVDRVRAATRLLGWAERGRLPLHPTHVMLIALLTDQSRPVTARCLGRLALDGEPARRIQEGAMAATLARRLDGARWRSPSQIAEALGRHSLEALAGAWIRGGRVGRRRVEWFLRRGRSVRPRLSGDDIVALGVPRGPAVGECLAALRQRRLDGLLRTRNDERRFVESWRDRGSRRSRPRFRIPRMRGRSLEPRAHGSARGEKGRP